MTEDTTLTDFASSGVGGSDSDGSGDGVEDCDNGGGVADGSGDGVEDCDSDNPDDLEDPADSTDGVRESNPVAEPTTTFARGDYECGACGRETERVWRDDGEYVCPSCKQW